ncbi:MAG TPA: hypothetical protein VE753_07940 [Gaiellaceae bacterium]|nr:hypothetical protein [Gaiellaceae bacterium]
MNPLAALWRRLNRDSILDAEYVEELEGRGRRRRRYEAGRYVKIAGSEELVPWLPERGRGITSGPGFGRTATRFRG